MKALGALAERVPDIVLPPPKASVVERRARLLNTEVPEPEGVPAHPTRIRDLGIAVVADAAHRALWNTLIAREHPHGMTTFAGCQVRYLVGSAHGWLGAAGFAAAALRAAARDRWVGWDDAGRRGHLQRVVCLSRFLIRPSVRCPHLASHVLGRILRRLPGDFEERYGFRPYLVESFADEGYNGTCLRAANFLCVGTTAGRGRQDREKRRARTVKTVFVYELERSWRTKLGVAPVDHAPSLEPGEGLNAHHWRTTSSEEHRWETDAFRHGWSRAPHFWRLIRGRRSTPLPRRQHRGQRLLPPDRGACGVGDHATKHPRAAP